ncbi:MAG TPA: sugar ABC transporter permease [Candidatus Limnocylindrales bacterium]|jgi:alpha-glucoside transport system permease protein|nr:sugar ABC transporter permease [Candidatus Limnocylindrales bacterium]
MAVANPPAGTTGGSSGKATGGGFSWAALFFMGPAALLLVVLLIFPTFYSLALSFNRGRGGQFSEWVGFDNYVRLFTADPNFLRLGFPPSGALWNNVLWLIFYTSLCVLLGLIIAVMATRVRYEALIKAIVFLPMAIAATAIAIIWRFVYFPSSETGLLNALLGIGGVGPVAFLGSPDTVNWALIVVGVWGSVGFATVILSAAIKGISSEVLEAARVDGANETQIFWRIIVPMVSLPISVVAVTLIVNVIKLFDLIYVMTNGGPGTSSRVIAFAMYQEAFPAGRFGYGAAIAVVMLLMLIPIMIFNVRRFRTEAVQQ